MPAHTTVHDDPVEGRHENGPCFLRPRLEIWLPVDLLMLGTDDLRARSGLTLADIMAGGEVPLREVGACAVGRAVPDAGEVATVSLVDGIHHKAEQHARPGGDGAGGDGERG